MWSQAGIERSISSLSKAKNELELMIEEVSHSGMLVPLQKQMVLDMIRSAWLVTFAAVHRKESRGAHKLVELRSENEDYQGNIVIQGKSFTLLKSSKVC
jgi:aspartate oxidase